GDDDSVGAARVEQMLDWIVALELAAGRWAASFKGCDSKSCARLSPTYDLGLAREKWVRESLEAMANGGGSELPVLGQQREPWQIGAAEAAKAVDAPPSMEPGDLASMEASGPPPETW
ncbi:MAG: hypothetical protein ACYDD0_09590, partial [Candidatus Dormibacteria bacterium]